MKNIWNKATALVLLSGTVLFASCEKEDTGTLEGPVPQASFTSVTNTTDFPTEVTFTSTSVDGFLYQWDFGDGTIGSGATVKHIYSKPGNYKVSLTAAGRGGTNKGADQTVTIADACDNGAFSKLVDCKGAGIRVWALSGEAGAVVKQKADGTEISASTGLDGCQLDDQFTFSSGYTLNYNAGGGTFVNGKCDKARANSGSFVYRPKGNSGQIILKGRGAFIGLPDSVSNKTYDILEATDTKLKLRGANPDGTFTVVTLTPYDATAPVKLLLTGGSSKTWKLDNSVDSPIVVGTEAAPTTYFGGVKAGELPACQSDDEYTFSTDNTLSYNAFAETFSAAKSYSCSAPETGISPFVFGPAAGTGLAQFTLSRTGAFIAATDASADRVYRIMDIDATHMTLRGGSGAGGGTVFTIKLVAK
jgi:PKD repeat protein